MSGSFRVETPNPEALDAVMRQMPMVVAHVVEGSYDGTSCEVQVIGDEGFVRFAINNQGYGKVVAS
jgi:hypothetical protein